MSHLLLNDRRFQIVAATITGVIADPYWCDKHNGGKGKELKWEIEVETKGRMFDGDLWRPNLGHSMVLPVRRWIDLVGQSRSWNVPVDRETGEPNGSFYVFEHADMPRATLTFGKRKGNVLRIDWEGKCHVHWSEPYRKNVPFSLKAAATFQGVDVHGTERDDKTAFRNRLGEYLDPADFRAGPIRLSEHKYKNGARLASIHFTPKA
jgi:hypothetical protein